MRLRRCRTNGKPNSRYNRGDKRRYHKAFYRLKERELGDTIDTERAEGCQQAPYPPTYEFDDYIICYDLNGAYEARTRGLQIANLALSQLS